MSFVNFLCKYLHNNTFLYNSTGFEDVANSWIEAIHYKYQSTSLWKAEGNPTSRLCKVHFWRDQFKIIHGKFNSSAFPIGILELFKNPSRIPTVHFRKTRHCAYARSTFNETCSRLFTVSFSCFFDRNSWIIQESFKNSDRTFSENPTLCLCKVYFQRDMFKIIHGKFQMLFRSEFFKNFCRKGSVDSSYLFLLKFYS